MRKATALEREYKPSTFVHRYCLSPRHDADPSKFLECYAIQNIQNDRNCYPCCRSILLPMCPVYTGRTPPPPSALGYLPRYLPLGTCSIVAASLSAEQERTGKRGGETSTPPYHSGHRTSVPEAASHRVDPNWSHDRPFKVWDEFVHGSLVLSQPRPMAAQSMITLATFDHAEEPAAFTALIR